MCAVHVPIELHDLLNPPSPARPPGQPQPTDRVPPGQETPQPPEPLGLPPDQQRAEQVPLQAAQPPGQDPDAPGQLRPEALAPDPAQESDLGVGLVRQAFQALVAENAAMVDDSFNFVPEHGGSARRYSRGGSRGRSRATGRRRLARQTSLPYPTSETASPGSSPRYALRNRAQIQQPTRYSDGNTNTQASLNYRREGRHQRQSSESSTLFQSRTLSLVTQLVTMFQSSGRRTRLRKTDMRNDTRQKDPWEDPRDHQLQKDLRNHRRQKHTRTPGVQPPGSAPKTPPRAPGRL